MTDRTAARLAWLLCALTVAFIVGYIPLRVLWHTAASAQDTTLSLQQIIVLTTNAPKALADALVHAKYLAFATLGALIVSRHRGNWIGWIFCALGLTSAAQEFIGTYAVYALLVAPSWLPGGWVAAWIQQWIWVAPIGLSFVALPLLYPTGRLLSARWRPVGWLTGAAWAALTFVAAFMPGPLGNYFDDLPPLPANLTNPLGLAALRNLQEVGGEGGGVILVILLIGLPMLAAIASLLLRLRYSRGDERAQLKWFAYVAALMTIVAILLLGLRLSTPPFYTPALDATVVWGLALLEAGLPIATGMAILKYRLYDIDLLINRTLVYGALTACVVVLYVLVVGGLGALLQAQGGLPLSILATGLVALLFQPLRARLQQVVNRLMYGERDDPYTLLTRLSQRLDAALAPSAMLPTIVQTVRDALHLPYVAIARQQGEEFEVTASVGKPVDDALRLPLTYQGQVVGQFLLGARAPGEAFSSADQRLLDGLARQVGVALHAAQLTADLQRARVRLVMAGEEERRRLRRDLHDGLGPALAAQSLKLEAARDLILINPEQAIALLSALLEESQRAITDIRRLVYALRPPELDELGLIAALRGQVARYAHPGLAISLEVPASLPLLPAAVEVAAYRIAQEGLTNVVRHAAASSCSLRLACAGAGDLSLEIIDNGRGLPPVRSTGVGLISMRERAEELGGGCVIAPAPAGGTRVSVRLPSGVEEWDRPDEEGIA